LPRSIAESQGTVSLGCRQIIIEWLEILKTIERSGEQRVGAAAAWPFLLSLPAVHPMVTVPATFHGRVAVLSVVAIVAAIQEGQFGFNFSRCLLRDAKSSYICNSGRVLRPRRARPANNSFTEFKFNQAWLAES
jgi:hypothetical protein